MPKLSFNGQADNERVRQMSMAGSSDISGSRGTGPKVKRVLHYYSNIVIPEGMTNTIMYLISDIRKRNIKTIINTKYII